MTADELQIILNIKITKALGLGYCFPKACRKALKKYLKTQVFNHQAYDYYEEELFKVSYAAIDDKKSKYKLYIDEIKDCFYAANLLSIFRANEQNNIPGKHDKEILYYCNRKN